jgi:hypothetical protein
MYPGAAKTNNACSSGYTTDKDAGLERRALTTPGRAARLIIWGMSGPKRIMAMTTWVATQRVRDNAVASTDSARPEFSSRRSRSAAMTAKIVQTRRAAR